MCIKYSFFSALLLLLSFSLSAQNQPQDTSEYPYWIQMMQDPDANFFETQKAFEQYWENREIQKGSGWKIFKRWEYFMSSRVDVEGNKPKADHVLREYQSYFGRGNKTKQSSVNHWEVVGPIQKPANGGTGQPNGLGRVNAISFHPSNPNILYVGAPAGGLWKTTNHGQSWNCLTDTLPTLGVSSIVVDHSNANTIYIGTGDRDGSDAPGLGVWKSVNSGATWQPSNNGLGNKVVGCMIMNPLNSQSILIGTNGGIYKTTDGGVTWGRTSVNIQSYKDIVYKPGDTSVVYATASGDFYRSTDGGNSWNKITSGLPGSDRLVIGVSPANSNYVYAVLTNTRTFKGMYLSTNSGISFTMMSNSPNIMDYKSDGSGTSGQAWYDLCVAVDPSNANVVYVGGVNIFKSSDGGVNWNINAHWTGAGNAPAVHADEHVLAVSPINSQLYCGNDGGIYFTTNGGSSWTDISSGLAISQIYKIGQSAQSNNLVINGYQDNGTAVYDGSWRTELGGDGMDCLIDPKDSNIMYGEYYYGTIRRSLDHGNTFRSIYKPISESGGWVTPYILSTGNSNTMFGGYKNIWRSTNVQELQDTSVAWTQISTGLALSNLRFIKVLENSPANDDILYFSRDDNRLFRSDNINDASPSYTDLTAFLPTASWPVDIEAHPTNANKVYIVVSNKVFESSDKGVTWTNISGTLPNVSMNTIEYDSSSNGNLYVGSDLGVFFKGSWMSDWIPFSAGLPNSIEVTELEIYYGKDNSQSKIKAATYGRGLWSSSLYSKPVAGFNAIESQVCLNQPVQFSDTSLGFYHSLLWTFPGGNPSSSTSSNPIVTYNSPGTYKVTLKIWNDSETDELVKTSYIKVDNVPVVTVNPIAANLVLGKSITLTASGGITYTWSPISGLSNYIGKQVIASPTKTLTYTVVGTNNYCNTTTGQGQSIITVVLNAIEEINFEKGMVFLHPNPASQNVGLSFNNVQHGEKNIRLIDAAGKLVLEKTVLIDSESVKMGMDISGQSNGYYILQIQGKNETLVIRLLIDHSF